jgi:hypothetical protein
VTRFPILVGLTSVEESPSPLPSPSLCLFDSLLQLRLSVWIWGNDYTYWQGGYFLLVFCKHMASYLFALVSSIFILHHSSSQTKSNQIKKIGI